MITFLIVDTPQLKKFYTIRTKLFWVVVATFLSIRVSLTLCTFFLWIYFRYHFVRPEQCNTVVVAKKSFPFTLLNRQCSTILMDKMCVANLLRQPEPTGIVVSVFSFVHLLCLCKNHIVRAYCMGDCVCIFVLLYVYCECMGSDIVESIGMCESTGLVWQGTYTICTGESYCRTAPFSHVFVQFPHDSHVFGMEYIHTCTSRLIKRRSDEMQKDNKCGWSVRICADLSMTHGECEQIFHQQHLLH